MGKNKTHFIYGEEVTDLNSFKNEHFFKFSTTEYPSLVDNELVMMKLMNAYDINKKILNKIKDEDVCDSFEQGYNNALEYVFELFKIRF